MGKESVVIYKKRIKYVGVDFFDTCVHRRCNPEAILYEWARRLVRNVGWSISSFELYDVRKNYEKTQKSSLTEELSYELLIGGVYDKLSHKLSNVISKEGFIDLSFDIEISVEKENIVIDDKIVQIFEDIKKSGKKIIVISDFYCGKSYIAEIAEKIGIDRYIDNYFISSDIGKRKSTGNLYRFIIKELNIGYDQLVMIGDNRISDYEIPKKLGIDSRLKKNTVCYAENLTKKSLKKKIYELAFCDYKKKPLNGFLPEILYFVSYLYKELDKHDVREALFCSREGQLIKRLFDIYQRDFIGAEKIRTIYFYVSRKATYLPSINKLDKENLKSIFGNGPQISIYDFLSCIEFSEDEINLVLENSGLHKEDIIDNELRSEKYKTLMKNKCFNNLFEEKKRKQKVLIEKYIDSLLSPQSCDKMVIVDIGWKGSIQDNLIKVFDGKRTIKGYYLGLMGENIKNTCDKRGILYTQNKTPDRVFKLLSKNYMYYERVFAADHGSVIGYIEDDYGVKPQISQNVKEMELYRFINPYQEIMVDTFERIIDLYKRTVYYPTDAYDWLIESALKKQCIYLPKIWNVMRLARTKAWENFGSLKNNKVRNELKLNVGMYEKKEFLYVEYTYRLLDKMHMRFLYPLAALYCRLVYFIKRNSIKNI